MSFFNQKQKISSNYDRQKKSSSECSYLVDLRFLTKQDLSKRPPITNRRNNSDDNYSTHQMKKKSKSSYHLLSDKSPSNKNHAFTLLQRQVDQRNYQSDKQLLSPSEFKGCWHNNCDSNISVPPMIIKEEKRGTIDGTGTRGLRECQVQLDELRVPKLTTSPTTSDSSTGSICTSSSSEVEDVTLVSSFSSISTSSSSVRERLSNLTREELLSIMDDVNSYKEFMMNSAEVSDVHTEDSRRSLRYKIQSSHSSVASSSSVRSTTTISKDCDLLLSRIFHERSRVYLKKQMLGGNNLKSYLEIQKKRSNTVDNNRRNDCSIMFEI